MGDAGQDEPQPDFPIGLLEGDGDRYVITEGAAEGMKGYFTRGSDGAVDGIHLGGRLATRVGAKSDPVEATVSPAIPG